MRTKANTYKFDGRLQAKLLGAGKMKLEIIELEPVKVTLSRGEVFWITFKTSHEIHKFWTLCQLQIIKVDFIERH